MYWSIGSSLHFNERLDMTFCVPSTNWKVWNHHLQFYLKNKRGLQKKQRSFPQRNETKKNVLNLRKQFEEVFGRNKKKDNGKTKANTARWKTQREINSIKEKQRKKYRQYIVGPNRRSSQDLPVYCYPNFNTLSISIYIYRTYLHYSNTHSFSLGTHKQILWEEDLFTFETVTRN